MQHLNGGPVRQLEMYLKTSVHATPVMSATSQVELLKIRCSFRCMGMQVDSLSVI